MALNLRKYSQTEKWYSYLTEYVVRYTIDQNILRKILEKGKDDGIAGSAARNENCPSDALKMVLERGKDDSCSRSAAKNPNCPPDALKMVFERGKNDNVSKYAAQNKNCPSGLLRMVLERERDDDVSRYAAKNPNCPKDAIIKWMIATGQIQIESPENKVQYVNPQKDDSDLKKLRELITSMKFNLNTFKKKASYEGGKGQATKETRGMMNCYKAKMDKGSTAQEAHEQCLKEYNDLNKKGEWATKYV